jgi:hypothetical protein
MVCIIKYKFADKKATDKIISLFKLFFFVNTIRPHCGHLANCMPKKTIKIWEWFVETQIDAPKVICIDAHIRIFSKQSPPIVYKINF